GETLVGCGAIVRDLVAFPDHHGYEPRDIQAVTRRARAIGASLLVTTEKDAMRLIKPGGATAGASTATRRDADAPLPVWALRIRLEPVVGPLAVADHGAPDPSRAVEAWRAELRARVEAAIRAARAGTPR